ncbi:sodium/proton antiporter NhaB [Sinimarinibacterium sp. CAU 1509]|uniref:sodium/proton antiporter NhaB n=1 Tax=Sinimarinibacterium sp. CAU 1509 TaxID=2562283 RepID=UPI0010AD8243|nr:sodium/proton antiporter NhaB [Sinimarinibacterium sp. CAU 1509]TJY64745.1 sodium/proton antiporter NhaB [Sinimarinibacterium sp. CAU 1509]
MVQALPIAFARNFLGHAPPWYKATILAFLLANPLLLLIAGPFVTGWVLVLEFIFTLAMALKCYPLQPGGLLAIEAVVLGMTSAHSVYHEAELNFAVIMLLMFMVAGIYFLREMLLYIFTKLLVKVRSKLMLSLMFSAAAAVLSAFLDALTVTAVVIAVATGFYTVYHKVASGRGFDDDHDHNDDELVHDPRKGDLDRFRAFLRNLMMHAAVGTALGGVTTLVGEPQNLLIGEIAHWDFIEFFRRVAPVSMPVLGVGLLTCAALEKLGWFSYGAQLPESVREVMERWETEQSRQRDAHMTMRLLMQAATAIFLIVGLALHLAEVGLIGLTVIVLATAFNGVIEEKRLGHAFEEALPFTALLVTFFAVVAVIHDQHLFKPVIDYVLAQQGTRQLTLMFVANGVLSMISDNVFVATVYITEVKQALDSGLISTDQFNLLAVAINAGTNIPSVATPNGQAAFLFLLTSALAPLIRLGYLQMMWMALPYTLTMSVSGLLATVFLLAP